MTGAHPFLQTDIERVFLLIKEGIPFQFLVDDLRQQSFVCMAIHVHIPFPRVPLSLLLLLFKVRAGRVRIASAAERERVEVKFCRMKFLVKVRTPTLRFNERFDRIGEGPGAQKGHH
jgi:hypothetical protein